MVTESLAGFPAIAIVCILYLGYYASFRHIYPLMAITIVGALTVAIYFGSPLGILLNIPEGMTNLELLKAVGPSIMLVVSATMGYFYAFRGKIGHTIVMGMLMLVSLVLGW